MTCVMRILLCVPFCTKMLDYYSTSKQIISEISAVSLRQLNNQINQFAPLIIIQRTATIPFN